MTKTEHTPKQPTHRVYAVTKAVNKTTDGAEKGFWTTIGAAWAHQDGKGFNVKLDYLPLTGAKIVIREPRAEGGRS